MAQTTRVGLPRRIRTVGPARSIAFPHFRNKIAMDTRNTHLPTVYCQVLFPFVRRHCTVANLVMPLHDEMKETDALSPHRLMERQRLFLFITKSIKA